MSTPQLVTLFYTKASPFSNLHPASFAWDARTCPTLAGRIPAGFQPAFAFSCSEQAFMYAKALYFGDFAIAGQIMETRTPNGQKKLGRAVKGFDADAWTAASVPIVECILVEKFAQNPALQQELRATSPRPRTGTGSGASA